MKKSRVSGLFFFIFLLVTGCAGDREESEKKQSHFTYYNITGEAQGTTYSITYSDSLERNLKQDVDDLLIRFDNSISIWNPGSLVSEFNGYNEVVMDSFMLHTWIRSLEIYRITNGAFNPTVYPLVDLWGFGLTNRQEVDSADVDSVMAMIDISLIDTVAVSSRFPDQVGYALVDSGRNLVDFNAIAQGYSVDLIGTLLDEKGINNYMIELGGEILCKGKNPHGRIWRIGIDHPEQDTNVRRLIAEVDVMNRAIATSGSYRKFYEKDGRKYSHTIDPKTGFPVDHNLLSASVMADDCETADAFATSFMVMGVSGTKVFLKDHPELKLEVYLIYEDDSGDLETFMTPGFLRSINEEI